MTGNHRTDDPVDRAIDAALRALVSEGAAPEIRAPVLMRIAERRAPPPARTIRRLAFAAALVTLCVVSFAWWRIAAPRRTEAPRLATRPPATERPRTASLPPSATPPTPRAVPAPSRVAGATPSTRSDAARRRVIAPDRLEPATTADVESLVTLMPPPETIAPPAIVPASMEIDTLSIEPLAILPLETDTAAAPPRR